MKTNGCNPYLPSWEYVPDGEPRVFGGRVYVYGSHDRFGGPLFCMNDYVCWSAPEEDLTDWRFEGVIYRKEQDPMNPGGRRCLYAPDVVQGPDGRYYLYYAFDFMGRIGVAVCDEPAGRFEFYGHVAFPDGHLWGERAGEPFPFDPGVLVDDDGRVYLYSGFATRIPAPVTGFRQLENPGGVAVELEPDMRTIRQGPHLLFPRKGRPGAFENHAFFEASSIRKVDGRYCFVYSSEHNHELCYAMADHPFGPFVFGGTLVDIGDVFLPGRPKEADAVNYLGNTHGSIACIRGQWYVFYHRQTNRHSYSRQACAEPLRRSPDGGFLQAPVSSTGLRGKPLPDLGRVPARIACYLRSGQGTARYDIRLPRLRLAAHPYFTQVGSDRQQQPAQYIANLRSGSAAGFSSFAFTGQPRRIGLRLRGSGRGVMLVSHRENGDEPLAVIPVPADKSLLRPAVIHPRPGVRPLYFVFRGCGAVDFTGFALGRPVCGVQNAGGYLAKQGQNG